mmetsp:Transcript_10882/g.39962  ORF Transcript_10882/g.39962 Transcript_10882/m.39962 type:complete len:218 (+) Transcript_10882:1921-2574(+)
MHRCLRRFHLLLLSTFAHAPPSVWESSCSSCLGFLETPIVESPGSEHSTLHAKFTPSASAPCPSALPRRNGCLRCSSCCSPRPRPPPCTQDACSARPCSRRAQARGGEGVCEGVHQGGHCSVHCGGSVRRRGCQRPGHGDERGRRRGRALHHRLLLRRVRRRLRRHRGHLRVPAQEHQPHLGARPPRLGRETTGRGRRRPLPARAEQPRARGLVGRG